jgi:hypothetical protein
MCRQKKDGNPASPAEVVPKVTFRQPPVDNPVMANARTSPEPDERKSGTPPVTPVAAKHAQRPTLSMPPGDLSPSSPWSVVD